MNKGFTLIEILTVVLIIGILTAVALPQYDKVIAKSRVVEAESVLRTIYDTSERLASEFGYRSYEKLLDDKGWANEADYSFGRTDMFDESRLPAGCTLPSADKTILKCKRFWYKISMEGSDGRRYVAAKKIGDPFGDTHILFDRQAMGLFCQPAASDTEGKACDIFGIERADLGINVN